MNDFEVIFMKWICTASLILLNYCVVQAWVTLQNVSHRNGYLGEWTFFSSFSHYAKRYIGHINRNHMLRCKKSLYVLFQSFFVKRDFRVWWVCLTICHITTSGKERVKTCFLNLVETGFTYFIQIRLRFDICLKGTRKI